MTETTRDPTFDRSPAKPVTTREDLISLLARASELEHGLACAYLFAAYSLKNDASEGGLNDGQAEMVRCWRRRLAQASVVRMSHLAQISNLLSAIGGAPHLLHADISRFLGGRAHIGTVFSADDRSARGIRAVRHRVRGTGAAIHCGCRSNPERRRAGKRQRRAAGALPD